MAGSKEAQARIKINQRLQESAWRFFDDENGRANVALESGVKITQQVRGFCDRNRLPAFSIPINRDPLYIVVASCGKRYIRGRYVCWRLYRNYL